MKHSIEVIKRMYCKGVVEVEADSREEAFELVESQIDSGELQTTAVEWDAPVYEDFTFETMED
jgi:hypothetical protein